MRGARDDGVVPGGGRNGSPVHGTSGTGATRTGPPVDGWPTHGRPTTGSSRDGGPRHSSPTDGSRGAGSRVNGSPANGSRTNGTPTNGTSVTGSRTNGTPTNGTSVTGSRTNGTSVTGSSRIGSPLAGSARNGAPATGPNGVAPGDQPAHGRRISPRRPDRQPSADREAPDAADESGIPTEPDIDGGSLAARLVADARENRSRRSIGSRRGSRAGRADSPDPDSPDPDSGTDDRASTDAEPADRSSGTASPAGRPGTGRRLPSLPAGTPAVLVTALAAVAAVAGRSRGGIVTWWTRRRERLAGYTPVQMRWHRVRMAGLSMAVVFIGLPVVVFLLGYLFFSVPTPDDAVNKQIATVSYADGSQLARVVPDEGNRVKVKIDQVPMHVQYAVLAAEDRSFFSNPGFDPIGIMRAAVGQLTGAGGGGSTITQQFVKNALVGDQHSLWRKYREMILAVKISQEKSKKDILADYLNVIYFGRGAYGIEAASQAYFGKGVGQLDTSEGALLAGVIQSPSRWDPAIDAPHALERWTFVVDGMARQGWITAEQRATAHFPVTVKPKAIDGGAPTDERGLVLSAVRDELRTYGISDQDFKQQGLKITTTIDPAAQKQAVAAATEGLGDQPKNLRGALVSVDPKTGAVLAYYGGTNGVGLDYARVRRQPGSTFKPFVLLAAMLLDKPIGLGTQFKGVPVPGGPRNADGASCQQCDLKQAMTISNNVIYQGLAAKVGPRRVADAARLAGITSPLDNPNAGIALGNKEVSTLELASAYATIAGGGVYHRPHLVSKVTTSEGTVIWDAVDHPEQRFSAQVARNVTEAMLGVPTHDNLTLSGNRAVAAKTGTVQNSVADQNKDAWTAGFTPTVASAVWIGTDLSAPIKTTSGTAITGGTLPATIWKDYMYDATKSRAATSFAPYKPLGDPPKETGAYDGLAAQSPTPTPTEASSVPATAPSLSSLPTAPLLPSYAPGEQRDCSVVDCTSSRNEGLGRGTSDSSGSARETGTPRPAAQGTTESGDGGSTGPGRDAAGG